MLAMVSYSRRPQSGQITCYLNRTYHVLLTSQAPALVTSGADMLTCAVAYSCAARGLLHEYDRYISTEKIPLLRS